MIDDEEDFAKMLQRSLKQKKHQADIATTGLQAIQLAARYPYDLALLDIRMPEITGLELLDYFQRNQKKIFVIMMTAFSSFSIGIESLKRGAYDYLEKPFKMHELHQKVMEALQRKHRYIREQQAENDATLRGEE